MEPPHPPSPTPSPARAYPHACPPLLQALCFVVICIQGSNVFLCVFFLSLECQAQHCGAFTINMHPSFYDNVFLSLIHTIFNIIHNKTNYTDILVGFRPAIAQSASIKGPVLKTPVTESAVTVVVVQL